MSFQTSILFFNEIKGEIGGKSVCSQFVVTLTMRKTMNYYYDVLMGLLFVLFGAWQGCMFLYGKSYEMKKESVFHREKNNTGLE